ncbi:unnamed protein product [Plutella xylostella]|uniref:(diamondback moth) hypothetical protein n=1 Tax=Plutella xylostella TaxID=51655 RepID=A0A8S4G9B4_PLUXY|nr:unnamed protein product [Plutella xylostella]
MPDGTFILRNELSICDLESCYFGTCSHLTRFMAIGQFLRRNLVSISFPTITLALIWADWSHTRQWKEQLKQTNTSE